MASFLVLYYNIMHHGFSVFDLTFADNMTEALLFLSHFMGDLHQVYTSGLFLHEFCSF